MGEGCGSGSRTGGFCGSGAGGLGPGSGGLGSGPDDQSGIVRGGDAEQTAIMEGV